MKMEIDIADEILESIRNAGHKITGFRRVNQGEEYWLSWRKMAIKWRAQRASHEAYLILEPNGPAYTERTPTQDDLADGPIKCWVREFTADDWGERELLAIIPASSGIERRYVCRHKGDFEESISWKFCKIRVPAEEVPDPTTKRVVPTLQMLADAGGEMECWVRDRYGDDWLHCTLIVVAPHLPSPFGVLDDDGNLCWFLFAEVEVPCE